MRKTVSIMNIDKKALFRRLPSVDSLLEEAEIKGLLNHWRRDVVVRAVQQELDLLRGGTAKESSTLFVIYSSAFIMISISGKKETKHALS